MALPHHTTLNEAGVSHGAKRETHRPDPVRRSNAFVAVPTSQAACEWDNLPQPSTSSSAVIGANHTQCTTAVCDMGRNDSVVMQREEVVDGSAQRGDIKRDGQNVKHAPVVVQPSCRSSMKDEKAQLRGSNNTSSALRRGTRNSTIQDSHMRHTPHSKAQQSGSDTAACTRVVDMKAHSNKASSSHRGTTGDVVPVPSSSSNSFHPMQPTPVAVMDNSFSATTTSTSTAAASSLSSPSLAMTRCPPCELPTTREATFTQPSVPSETSAMKSSNQKSRRADEKEKTHNNNNNATTTTTTITASATSHDNNAALLAESSKEDMTIHSGLGPLPLGELTDAELTSTSYSLRFSSVTSDDVRRTLARGLALGNVDFHVDPSAQSSLTNTMNTTTTTTTTTTMTNMVTNASLTRPSVTAHNNNSSNSQRLPDPARRHPTRHMTHYLISTIEERPARDVASATNGDNSAEGGDNEEERNAVAHVTVMRPVLVDESDACPRFLAARTQAHTNNNSSSDEDSRCVLPLYHSGRDCGLTRWLSAQHDSHYPRYSARETDSASAMPASSTHTHMPTTTTTTSTATHSVGPTSSSATTGAVADAGLVRSTHTPTTTTQASDAASVGGERAVFLRTANLTTETSAHPHHHIHHLASNNDEVRDGPRETTERTTSSAALLPSVLPNPHTPPAASGSGISIHGNSPNAGRSSVTTTSTTTSAPLRSTAQAYIAASTPPSSLRAEGIPEGDAATVLLPATAMPSEAVRRVEMRPNAAMHNHSLPQSTTSLPTIAPNTTAAMMIAPDRPRSPTPTDPFGMPVIVFPPLVLQPNTNTVTAQENTLDNSAEMPRCAESGGTGAEAGPHFALSTSGVSWTTTTMTNSHEEGRSDTTTSTVARHRALLRTFLQRNSAGGEDDDDDDDGEAAGVHAAWPVHSAVASTTNNNTATALSPSLSSIRTSSEVRTARAAMLRAPMSPMPCVRSPSGTLRMTAERTAIQPRPLPRGLLYSESSGSQHSSVIVDEEEEEEVHAHSSNTSSSSSTCVSAEEALYLPPHEDGAVVHCAVGLHAMLLEGREPERVGHLLRSSTSIVDRYAV